VEVNENIGRKGRWRYWRNRKVEVAEDIGRIGRWR